MDPTPDGNILGSTIESIKTDSDGKKKRHIRMSPGMTLHPKKDEHFEVVEAKNPNTEWMPFIRFLIRLSGTLVGMPLEMMLLDVSDTNYTGGRMLRELARRRSICDQADAAAVADRIFNWWLSREKKYNGLVVPAEIEATYWRHTWGKPRATHIDPVKDMTAAAKAVELRVRTRASVSDEINDDDYPDVIKAIERENELLDEAGISTPVATPGTQPQDEPDAKDEDDKEDDDEK
jgi:capsid protein